MSSAPVEFFESIRKFVQRLPVNGPPNVPGGFVEDEGKIPSAHQTHLPACRDTKGISLQQTDFLSCAAPVMEVHIKHVMHVQESL